VLWEDLRRSLVEAYLGQGVAVFAVEVLDLDGLVGFTQVVGWGEEQRGLGLSGVDDRRFNWNVGVTH
jgi:hypothetical protein